MDVEGLVEEIEADSWLVDLSARVGIAIDIAIGPRDSKLSIFQVAGFYFCVYIYFL